jgi:hypothetical protein
LDWLFCNDTVFDGTHPEARLMIIDAIKNNLSPSITTLLRQK